MILLFYHLWFTCFLACQMLYFKVIQYINKLRGEVPIYRGIYSGVRHNWNCFYPHLKCRIILLRKTWLWKYEKLPSKVAHCVTYVHKLWLAWQAETTKWRGIIFLKGNYAKWENEYCPWQWIPWMHYIVFKDNIDLFVYINCHKLFNWLLWNVSSNATPFYSAEDSSRK